MDFLVLYNLFIFFIFLIDSIGIWLALIVHRANPKARISQVFIAMTAISIIWITLAAGARILAIHGYNLNYSLISLKIAWFVTPWLFFFLYYFTILLIEGTRKYATLTKINLTLAVVSSIVVLFNLVLAGIKFIDGILYLSYGKAISFFLASIFIMMSSELYPLFRGYKNFSEDKRKQLKPFLIGVFILDIANFIFNIVLPMIFNISQYYYFGDYSLIFFLGFTAYSIARYQFMGIKLIFTELLIIIMASILMIAPFFVGILWLKILLWIVFILFLFFGYLLIKSVRREVYQKEILRQMVKEKTKDLEKERDIAQERAREIEKRKADLEHFYKLTVGRELKMIELKKKIKELELKRKMQ